MTESVRESRNEAAQIRDQYLAIAYLARQIAHVHEQLSRVSWSLPASVCGPDSAARLETLANICNAMDIVEKEDDWVNPILLKAHEMYPQAFTQSEIEPTALEQATQRAEVAEEACRLLRHDLERALTNHAADLTPSHEQRSEPDAYAVLLDDKASGPKGFWFVGTYHSKDLAENVVAKGKQGARVVPMFFAQSASGSISGGSAEGTLTPQPVEARHDSEPVHIPEVIGQDGTPVAAPCVLDGCYLMRKDESLPNLAEQELRNIANAERFNREMFRDDTEFADWAQSRCRHTLSRSDSRNDRA